MVPLVGDPSSLLIRWVHVVGMALLVGGAVLTWGTLRATGDHAVDLRAAAAYEWVFWGGAGLLVLTGVGNLGALAPSVPGPTTAWGLTFSAKVAVVVGLLVGSVPRTLSVVGRPVAIGPTAGRRLRVAYAATAVYLLALVALAEVLAHG